MSRPAVQRLVFRLLWVLGILAAVAGSLSSDLKPPAGGVIDKLQHIGAYMVLSGLAIFSFRSMSKRLGALTFLFLLGITIEIAQAFVGREASALDQLANTIGIVLGATICLGAGHFVRKQI